MFYKSNYGLEFPELKHIPMRAQYVEELGLPSEIISVARRMTKHLGIAVKFPTPDDENVGVLRISNHPEVLLVASIILATKHCLPFDNNEYWKGQFPRMDWHKWNDLVGQLPTEEPERKPIIGMDEAEIDDLVRQMTREPGDRDQPDVFTTWLREHFPRPPPGPPSNILALEPRKSQRLDSVILQRIKHEAMRPQVEKEPPRGGGMVRCVAWKTCPDVPDIAMPFVRLAASISGLSLSVLVKVVDTLELKLTS